jgi:bifunctional DNA-binding transcriptional regulator/antitoxin component of YhaV-PrlF toxin-antitoxin module
MSILVGTKGQVTIEKELREALGIEPGWRAIQRLEGEQIVLEFVPPRHRRSLAGILRDKAKATFPTPESLEDAVDVAWARAAQDDEHFPAGEIDVVRP